VTFVTDEATGRSSRHLRRGVDRLGQWAGTLPAGPVGFHAAGCAPTSWRSVSPALQPCRSRSALAGRPPTRSRPIAATASATRAVDRRNGDLYAFVLGAVIGDGRTHQPDTGPFAVAVRDPVMIAVGRSVAELVAQGDVAIGSSSPVVVEQCTSRCARVRVAGRIAIWRTSTRELGLSSSTRDSLVRLTP